MAVTGTFWEARPSSESRASGFHATGHHAWAREVISFWASGWGMLQKMELLFPLQDIMQLAEKQLVAAWIRDFFPESRPLVSSFLETLLTLLASLVARTRPSQG